MRNRGDDTHRHDARNGGKQRAPTDPLPPQPAETKRGKQKVCLESFLSRASCSGEEDSGSTSVPPSPMRSFESRPLTCGGLCN